MLEQKFPLYLMDTLIILLTWTGLCEQTIKYGTDIASMPDASSYDARTHVELKLHLRGEMHHLLFDRNLITMIDRFSWPPRLSLLYSGVAT